MNLSPFIGCLTVAIIALVLFMILYGDEIGWVLSQLPMFLKNFFMAIGKAWRLSVQGININCSPINKLKVKDKKVRDCRRNKLLLDIKETEDVIDEDKAKDYELKKAMADDSIKETFAIYADRKVKKENVKDPETETDGINLFYHNEKSDNPLVSVGYTNSDEAQKGCESIGAQLASKDQLVKAYSGGINWCNYGWLKENTEICLPLQIKKYDRLTNRQREMGMCGSYDGAGVNCMKPLKGEKYGAICYSKNKKIE